MISEPGGDEIERLAQLLQAGALGEARTFGGELSRKHPNSAAVWHLLGGAFSLSGEDRQAVSAFSQAIVCSAEATLTQESRLYCAIALSRLGEQQSALEHLAQILQLEPNCIPAYLAQARAYERLGDAAGAERAYRQALQRDAADPRALTGLGGVLHLLGRDAEAKGAFRTLLAGGPSYEAHIGLGMCSLPQELAAAEEHFRAALKIRSAGAEALDGLSFIAREGGRLAASLCLAQKAVEASGRQPQYLASLAVLHRERAETEQALALLNECCEKAPQEAAYFSARLLTMQYRAGYRREELFRAHREWAVRFAGAFDHARVTPSSAGAGACRVVLGGGHPSLRIGFLSPDFRAHPVAGFLEAILEEMRRQGSTIFLYSCNAVEDAVTRRLRAAAGDGWRTLCGVSDEAAATLVQRDHLDWLIDLAGHTPGNRLGVLFRRPAKRQATWLGYPDTTGSRTVDYRIVDANTDPAGAEAWISEKLLRLPGCFLCYRPHPEAPPVSQPPCKRDGHITFGSFNNPAKLSDPCLRLWGQILKTVPNSRLFIKGVGLEELESRAYWVRRLKERGIDPERVELAGKTSGVTAHLRQYDRVDIALDPFPYNGTTTTCEALWQGVPVLTRCGDSHAGHVGASLLETCGLADWISSSDEGVMALARWHATGPDCAARLMELRTGLRSMMRPLTDVSHWVQIFLHTLFTAS